MWRFILLWIFLILSFSIAGGYLILSAVGYRVDWQNKRFEKTGVISINTDPSTATISIDGKIVASSAPQDFKRIVPGTYEIKVESSGYNTWIRRIEVAPGLVTNLGWIMLFLTSPKIEPALPGDENLLNNTRLDSDLIISGNEIYRLDNNFPKLITRFSSDVLSARWFEGKHYLVYQLGDKINLSENDGQGVVPITTLPNDHLANMVFVNNKTLLVRQDQTMLRITVR